MTFYARLGHAGEILEYPYDLNKLRKTCSFRVDPPAELLAGHGIVIVHETPRPEVDHTWNVREGDPQLVDGLWRQSWDVKPASEKEIRERIPPDWENFKSEFPLIPGVNMALTLALQQDPWSVLNLPASLLSNKHKDFQKAWSNLIKSGHITQTVFDRTVALARKCNLPSQFIQELLKDESGVKANRLRT